MLAYCPLLLALKAAPCLPTETAPILLSKPSGKCRLKDLLSPSTLMVVIVNMDHLPIHVYIYIEVHLFQGLDTLFKTENAIYLL